MLPNLKISQNVEKKHIKNLIKSYSQCLKILPNVTKSLKSCYF